MVYVPYQVFKALNPETNHKTLSSGLVLGLSRTNRYHTYNSEAVKACDSSAVARDVGSHGFHKRKVARLVWQEPFLAEPSPKVPNYKSCYFGARA